MVAINSNVLKSGSKRISLRVRRLSSRGLKLCDVCNNEGWASGAAYTIYIHMVSNSRTRHPLLKRGLRLEYVTLSWNAVGVVVLAAAAVEARSVALAGFGLDSAVEIFASVIVVWELTGSGSPEREQRALRLIGTAFFALALYITGQAGWALMQHHQAGTSRLGIAWTAVTCAVMLGLAFGKAVTGRALGNRVLQSEGRVTLIDAYLAGAVLLGLIATSAFGWWWADPLASFVIVFYGLKEGRAAWTNRHE